MFKKKKSSGVAMPNYFNIGPIHNREEFSNLLSYPPSVIQAFIDFINLLSPYFYKYKIRRMKDEDYIQVTYFDVTGSIYTACLIKLTTGTFHLANNKLLCVGTIMTPSGAKQYINGNDRIMSYIKIKKQFRANGNKIDGLLVTNDGSL